MKTERLETSEGYPNSSANRTQASRLKRFGVVVLSLLSVAAAASPETQNNTLDMPFVRIPAGEFMMGNDESPSRWLWIIRNTTAIAL